MENTKKKLLELLAVSSLFFNVIIPGLGNIAIGDTVVSTFILGGWIIGVAVGVFILHIGSSLVGFAGYSVYT